jgi:hypothetical protein
MTILLVQTNLSSRPEESWALWLNHDDEKRFGPATTLYGTVALTLVTSTEAQRSGEISVLTPLSGNVFRQSVA